ncbi:MAG: cytochrome c biogenesis protein CcsA [Polyangia bacterium]
MPPLFPLTLALYAVACTLYFVAVAQPQLVWPGRAARPALLLGILGQAVDIAWLCLHGAHPGSSAREAIFFVAWLLVGALPLVTVRHASPLLGTLLLPLAMVLDVVARVVPVHEAHALRGGAAHSPALLSAHIFSATLGTALFGVAAAASVVYLLAERRLKRRLPALGLGLGLGLGAINAAGTTGARGAARPSLETLDSWNRYGITFGFLALTIAALTGTSWLLLSGGSAIAGRGLGDVVRFLFGKPQYTLSIITWLIYAALLGARLLAGLRGRRAAVLTLTGFCAALSVLAVYLLRDVRGQAP